MDMSLDAEVAIASDVSCLLCAVSASDDMIVAGHRPEHIGRLFVETGTDIKPQDVVLVDGDRWHVISPPETHTLRGEAHHIEAIVEKQEVS